MAVPPSATGLLRTEHILDAFAEVFGSGKLIRIGVVELCQVINVMGQVLDCPIVKVITFL